jgi:hypothetical protein
MPRLLLLPPGGEWGGGGCPAPVTSSASGGWGVQRWSGGQVAIGFGRWWADACRPSAGIGRGLLQPMTEAVVGSSH